VPRLAEAVIHTSPSSSPGPDTHGYHDVVAHHFAHDAEHVPGRSPESESP